MNRPDRSWSGPASWGLAILLASVARADDAPPRPLPAEVERMVRWLPEDTETLAVARSFALAPAGEPFGAPDWTWLGRAFAAEGILLDKIPGLAPLGGRRIAWAIRGGARYEGVSSFGALRDEGCTILAFESDLDGGGRALADGLRQHAKSPRTVAGREVFVYPTTAVKEPWVRNAPWEGTFLVVLTPRVLLCASSDRTIDAVLRRVDAAPARRALPADLPEWREVDVEAPAWLVRHFPAGRIVGDTVGLAATFRDRSCRIAYLPRTGTAVYPEMIRRQWYPEKFTRPEQRLKFPIERHPDGVVTFTATGLPSEDEELWPVMVWPMWRLPAQDLFLEAAPVAP